MPDNVEVKKMWIDKTKFTKPRLVMKDVFGNLYYIEVESYG